MESGFSTLKCQPYLRAQQIQLACYDKTTYYQGIQSADSIHAINLLTSDLFSLCHVDLLKCTEQNVNNQSLIQVLQLYVHISFVLK